MNREPCSRPFSSIVVERAAVRTVVLMLAALSLLNAQRPLFGTVRSFPIPGFANRITILPDNNTGKFRFLLWTRGRNAAWLGSLDSEHSTVTWLARHLSDTVHMFVAGSTKLTGGIELAGVRSSDNTLFVISNVDADTLRGAAKIRLPFLPDGMIRIGDPPRSDLLLFSRANPGIVPVIGVDGKNPRIGRTIIPDMPVGDMTAANLNDDGIPDLIVYDWVQSELHFLYGVGQTRFLDQTTLPVKDGISRLLSTETKGGETRDIIMVSADTMKLDLWHGDGFGDFTLQSSFTALSAVRACKVHDFNGDGWPDIAYVDSRGALHALLNNGQEEFEDGPEVSAGESPQSFEFLSPDGSASIVLDPVGKQLLLFEDGRPRVLTDSLRFAAGLGPSALVLGDINNDSRIDIVLATTLSRSLEFFLSDTTGALSGAVVVRLNEENTLLGPHSVSDSMARFIVASPKQGSISFVSYHVSDGAHSEALIPGVGALEPLFAAISPDDRIGYYCYGAPGESVTSSLSLFQQLDGDRFIERSFKLTIPDTLMGAAVDDLNNDHRMDAAYLYRNAASGKYEFAIAYGDSTNEFTRRGVSFPLQDTTIAKSYLYFADVNKDSVLDLLFFFPKSARTIRLALGDSNGSYSAARKLEAQIRIDNRAQMQILDIDRDGCVDIAVNDPVRGGVGYLKGDGAGGFAPWKALYVFPGISHFGFADFNNDGVNDLVVAMKSEGVVKIISGSLILFP